MKADMTNDAMMDLLYPKIPDKNPEKNSETP
jgi:hypothetical protein